MESDKADEVKVKKNVYCGKMDHRINGTSLMESDKADEVKKNVYCGNLDHCVNGTS